MYVHAKIGIVDDGWLTLGSANLNEHSLFNDTEVNVVIDDAALATSTRQRLWAEHLELPAEQVAGMRGRSSTNAGDRSRRSSSSGSRRGAPLTHRLVRLPHVSRRSKRLLGPVQSLLVDGYASPEARVILATGLGWPGTRVAIVLVGGPPCFRPNPRRLRHTDRVEWLTDIHEAEWIAPRLHPFLTDVGSVIPVGYEAYARIFHPVRRAGGGLESWGDVAERNGRIAHPEMQFHLIDTPRGEPPRDDVWTAEKPEAGSLPLESRRALVEHLDPVTAPAEMSGSASGRAGEGSTTRASTRGSSCLPAATSWAADRSRRPASRRSRSVTSP